MPRVSVIMSVYNEPIEWIRLAIESILNQSFSDFEFIIINDKPDRIENVELLDDFKLSDSRIIVISNETNMGLTKSLNRGLAIARGEYIARMDADDISMPERLIRQVEYLNKYSDIVACGSYRYVINENGKFVRKQKAPTDSQTLRDNLIVSSPISHPVSFFRRVVDSVPVMYNENRRYSQDYALWISLSKNHDLANIPLYLLKYRESSQQISSKYQFAQQECARLNSEEAMISLGLTLRNEDKSVILGMTRVNNPNLTPFQIENSLQRIFVNNMKNENIRIKRLIKSLILIYCNYLPKYYPFFFSFKRFITISLKIGCFDFYSLFSLINKLGC